MAKDSLRHHAKQQKVSYSHSSKKVAEKSSGSSSSSSAEADLSFLFVVHELSLNYADPAAGGTLPEYDEWGNRLPPRTTNGFVGEIVSPVFRYRNRVVTQANARNTSSSHASPWHYSWIRGGGWGQPGDICATNLHDPNAFRIMTPLDHGTFTVFRGWRFLPVVFMNSDATTTDVDEGDEYRKYWPLRFTPHEMNPAVSQAVFSGNLHVSGNNAAWIGKLVPNSFANPYDSVQSRGLGGQLGVILGLMGLSQPAGHVREAFRYWRDKRWEGPNWSSLDHRPGPTDEPRGVVVHICFDDLEHHPRESCEDRLTRFQWEEVIVRG